MHYYSGPLLSRLIVQRQHQCSPGFRRPHLTSQHPQGQNKGDFKDAAFGQKELPLSTPVTKSSSLSGVGLIDETWGGWPD